MTATQCTDCGTGLAPNPRRKTTWCKPCNARRIANDPAKLAKCRVAMKAHFTDPAYLATHRAKCKVGWDEAMKRPEFAAQRREQGRRVGLLRVGFNSLPPRHPARMAAGRKVTASRLAWCPVEYRAEYLHLRRSKLIPAPEARKIIEDQIAVDLANYTKTGQLPQAGRAAREARRRA